MAINILSFSESVLQIDYYLLTIYNFLYKEFNINLEKQSILSYENLRNVLMNDSCMI